MDEVRELVFSMSMVERRAETIENYNKRKQTETALYPAGEILRN